MVHGVIGVVVLSMCAADPGRFQQLFFLSLIIPLLFLLLSLSVPFTFPLSLSLSVAEGLLGLSAPDGGVAALSARAGGALRPSVPLIFPATAFPVSARGTTSWSLSVPVRRLGSPAFSVTMPLPATIPAPVSGGSPASVVLRPVPSTLRPAAPVWTPPAVLPLARKFHFMPITVARVAVALLPVVIVAVRSLWRPPVVHWLVIFVLPAVPEAVVWFE